MSSATQPAEIRLLTASRRLEVLWSDGMLSRHDFLVLRQRCRCAECVSASARGAAPVADGDIRIVDIVPVGNYALQLRFSDGHDRGIYPFAYLRELGADAPLEPS